jgi:hypothetical protein
MVYALSMMLQDKIAQLLRVAEWRLTYCEVIVNYPASVKQKDFDTVFPIDLFYKNVCIMSFNDVVLILGSLLDKDKKAISFWNWPDFVIAKEIELTSLKGRFESEGLKRIRDQVIAHQDTRHQANIFPDSRIRGYIHPQYVQRVQGILLELVSLFFVHTEASGTPYSPDYFDNSRAREEIVTILGLAKPKLTNGVVG